jgi:hypothetical protein
MLMSKTSRVKPKNKASRNAFRRRVARAQRRHGQYAVVRTGRRLDAQDEA